MLAFIFIFDLNLTSSEPCGLSPVASNYLQYIIIVSTRWNFLYYSETKTNNFHSFSSTLKQPSLEASIDQFKISWLLLFKYNMALLSETET